MRALQTVCESGMYFSCDSSCTFFVEKYVHDTGLQGVKAVEFIRQKNKSKIFLVEAKTSAPHHAGSSPDDFKKFIDEIVQKAIDSFSLLFSVITLRRQAALGNVLAKADYSRTKFCLVLIIKNHEKEWLANVQNALSEQLRHFYTAWNWGSTPVVVLNEEMAIDQGLILPPPENEN